MYLVVVEHGAGLGLDGDSPLSLHIQLVKNLLVATGLNGPREF